MLTASAAAIRFTAPIVIITINNPSYYRPHFFQPETVKKGSQDSARRCLRAHNGFARTSQTHPSGLIALRSLPGHSSLAFFLTVRFENKKAGERKKN